MVSNDQSFRSVADLKSLDSLKLQASKNDPKALETVAKQFESLFINMLMQNMRKANEGISKNSYFNSDQTKFYQDMLDQQMSLSLSSGKGIGISDALIRQLGPKQRDNAPIGGAVETNAFSNNIVADGAKAKNAAGAEVQPSRTARQLFEQAMGNSARTAIEALAKREHGDQIPDLPQLKPGDFTATLKAMESSLASQSLRDVDSGAVKTAIEVARAIVSAEGVSPASIEQVQVAALPERFSGPSDFVQGIYPLAVNAAQEMGVDPRVLVAQAALETGWGKNMPANSDGSSSFNLFGIKADQRWNGDAALVNTLEFRDGVAAQEKAAFRSYGSYEESLRDYVDFVRTNPRYEKALAQVADGSAYLQQLQLAGYATDPNYAGKISAILNGEVLQSALVNTKEI